VAKQGILLVLSAPSGAGKHTVLSRLRGIDHGLTTAISATTRAPRQGEKDGRDYYFLSREEFDRRVAAGAFAEWAEVHGNRYGTLHTELDRCLETGGDVLLELDVQGMRNMRSHRPDMVSVFLMAPSLDELERRLRDRNTEDEATISLRLKNARAEVDARKEFDYIVVNDTVDEAAEDLRAILRAERCRASRQP
jgi:guanylate kinase